MDSYEQAIEYLLTFADFERSGSFQERPDMAPMQALLKRLGNPHLGRVTVHVAGSKGKGSTCAMVESILRAVGLSTGLYTSPHLHDYTERIRISGEPIDHATFVRLARWVREAAESVAPTLGDRRFVTFDLLTAMGFLAFQDARVEAQVVEVGLGGRVDSTNVFERKEVAVITPISLEHTAILGGTFEAIAKEKAGIITPGCIVVLGAQQHPEAEEAIAGVAAERGASLIRVEHEYQWSVAEQDPHGQTVRIEWPDGSVEAGMSLPGRHQAANAAAAIAAADALQERFPSINAAAMADGLAAARWPGRFEVVHETPVVIVDGSHNADSARAFVETLRSCCGEGKTVLVVGSSADKDIDALAAEFRGTAERVFATKANHPRAMEPQHIRQAFEAVGIPAENVDSVGEAIDRAMAASGEGGLICLVGSLFVVAEGREYFGLG